VYDKKKLMKLEKLLTNTAFGFFLREFDLDNHKIVEFRDNYDNFLSQILELWMFVPCKLVNGVWVVLEEPFNDGENDQYYSSAMQEYQEAKDRVLFDGFKFKGETNYCWIFTYRGAYPNRIYKKDIEMLANRFKNLVLTPTAQKQIGL
jgi:hypothetical protein